MALKRQRDRKMLEIMSYDGAARGRRTEGWVSVSSSSATTELRPALGILRDRSRDLARNNRYGIRAITQIAGHMIGPGIMPIFVTDNESRRKKLNDLWRMWAENDVLGDFDEEQNVYGLQGLIARTIAESGECLVLRHWSKDTRLPIPLQLQVLEPDYIDSSHDTGVRLKGEEFDCMGIQFNAKRKKSGYWLYDNHPGESGIRASAELYPVKDIIHAFRRDRPGQIRGAPWLAPCVIDFRDFSDYEDAQLLRQKIAACFAAFINNPDGESTPEDLEELSRIEPGRIEDIGNKSILFAEPPGAENYDSYTKTVLRGIAAGTGLTYEMLSDDYEHVNFSSARMAKNDFFMNLDVWQWQMYVPMVLMKIGRWFLEACELAGHDISGVSIDWTPPRRQLVDATREIPAMVAETRAGFKSRSQQIRELGYDPEQVEAEFVEDNARADAAGLIFTTDARKTTNGGQEQQIKGFDYSDEGGEKNKEE